MGKWSALFWIALAELFALSMWFSASAIVLELREAWRLPSGLEAWVSATVPIGFVVGAFFSSYYGISDRFNPRKVFAYSAFLGAICNGALLFVDQAYVGFIFRFLTGITLAGVYPTAVKLLSQWFPKKRGLAIGILIAGLTVGSSLPHLLSLSFASIDWRLTLGISSLLAIIAGMIIRWVVIDAPTAVVARGNHFSFSFLGKILKNKPVMLANFGYFGHMWELYAMWTWLPLFLTASFSSYFPEKSLWLSALSSFLSIGVAGAIGCVLGGFLADRMGRSLLTVIAMAVSASCALLIGFTYGQSIWLTLLLSIIWGIFVIADSAQFSAAVSEFAEMEYVGTALTFQMCIGFLITILSINLIPLFQKLVGWEWVFTILSLGPILGLIAMLKFRPYEISRNQIKPLEP